jgi:hypothetical protein
VGDVVVIGSTSKGEVAYEDAPDSGRFAGSVVQAIQDFRDGVSSLEPSTPEPLWLRDLMGTVLEKMVAEYGSAQIPDIGPALRFDLFPTEATFNDAKRSWQQTKEMSVDQLGAPRAALLTETVDTRRFCLLKEHLKNYGPYSFFSAAAQIRLEAVSSLLSGNPKCKDDNRRLAARDVGDDAHPVDYSDIPMVPPGFAVGPGEDLTPSLEGMVGSSDFSMVEVLGSRHYEGSFDSHDDLEQSLLSIDIEFPVEADVDAVALSSLRDAIDDLGTMQVEDLIVEYPEEGGSVGYRRALSVVEAFRLGAAVGIRLNANVLPGVVGRSPDEAAAGRPIGSTFVRATFVATLDRKADQDALPSVSGQDLKPEDAIDVVDALGRIKAAASPVKP